MSSKNNRYKKHRVHSSGVVFQSLTEFHRYIKSKVEEKDNICVSKNKMINVIKKGMSTDNVDRENLTYIIHDESMIIEHCARQICKDDGTIYIIKFKHQCEQNQKTKVYIGLTQKSLKERLKSHIADSNRKKKVRNSLLMRELRDPNNANKYEILPVVENVKYDELPSQEEEVLTNYLNDNEYNVLNQAKAGSAYGRYGSHFVICSDSKERHMAAALSFETKKLDLEPDAFVKLQSRIKELYTRRKKLGFHEHLFVDCVNISIDAFNGNKNVRKSDTPVYMYQNKLVSAKEIAEILGVEKSQISSRLDRLKGSYRLEGSDITSLINDPKSYKPKAKSKTLDVILKEMTLFKSAFTDQLQYYLAKFQPSEQSRKPSIGSFLKGVNMYQSRSSFYLQAQTHTDADVIIRKWSELYDRYNKS